MELLERNILKESTPQNIQQDHPSCLCTDYKADSDFTIPTETAAPAQNTRQTKLASAQSQACARHGGEGRNGDRGLFLLAGEKARTQLSTK